MCVPTGDRTCNLGTCPDCSSSYNLSVYGRNSQGLLVIRYLGKEWALLRGHERHRSRQGKVRAATGKAKGGKSLRSLILRTYVVGRMRVKK